MISVREERRAMEDNPASHGDDDWRRQAERLQHALDGAGQGVWEHDLVAGQAFFSAAWKRMRGYAPDEDVDALAGPW
ncbi:MAG: hypothetical protein EOP88_26900, partial [Verrucomicrobiaceae bacterium]